jgi:hypothetical protein
MINRIRRTRVGVPVGNSDSIGLAVTTANALIANYGLGEASTSRERVIPQVPVTEPVKLITADTTLTAADSGKTIVFNDASGNIATLPNAKNCKGCRFTFYTKVLATSGVHSVSPNALDGIGGGVSALTTVIDKDLQNDTGSDAVGDRVTIQSTGANGTGAWVITDFIGAYAKQA